MKIRDVSSDACLNRRGQKERHGWSPMEATDTLSRDPAYTWFSKMRLRGSFITAYVTSIRGLLVGDASGCISVYTTEDM